MPSVSTACWSTRKCLETVSIQASSGSIESWLVDSQNDDAASLRWTRSTAPEEGTSVVPLVEELPLVEGREKLPPWKESELERVCSEVKR